MDTFAYDHGLPCRNPNCKSHGKPHPNCRCYTGGESGTPYWHEAMAKGGMVHFCSTGMPHLPGCEYYASGGEIELRENPSTSLGHAAVSHGLLGLLTKVGRSNLADSDKHKKVLEDARMHNDRMKNPIEGLDEPKKTMGVRLASHLADKNHESAAELMHGHPMVGGMGKSALKELMPRMAGPMMDNEPHPDGLRSAFDYFHSAIKGHNTLDDHIGSFLGKSKQEKIKPDIEARDAIKNHLLEVKTNPEKLLDVGGSLGHYLPNHAAQLAATSATATDYLNSIKPQPQQANPLDQITKPSKSEESLYDRQVDIAQNPMLLLQHVKNGTLLPDDIETIQTIYPGLYHSILSKAGDALIEAKHNNVLIPYRQKQALSQLLGQPLDMTQTPMAMQAIMHSQGVQQQQQQAKGKPKRATDTEMKQINKVDALYATPTERREMQKRE